MARDHDYYVYLLTNATRTVLYIGVTSELEGRIITHRTGLHNGSFTERNHVNRLVYYEEFGDVQAAIAREKQLKGWRRVKKEVLIAKINPRWEDLSAAWERRHNVLHRYVGERRE